VYRSPVNPSAARIVECGRCGAPAGATTQTEATCKYCGAVTVVAPRPNDGGKVVSPADEIARLSRLQAQVDHAVAGHVYDLETFPPLLAAGGHLPSVKDQLPELERLWPWAKSNAPAGLEQQRALLWVASNMARSLRGAGRDEVGRARLETSLNLLADPGHRLLARTNLARAAIAAGGLQEAATLLSECDPAPEVLELDSALRYSSARLKLAQGDPTAALVLLGPDLSNMPFSKALAAHAELARIHAYEVLGNTAKAEQLWAKSVALAKANPLELARSEDLAPRTRLGPLRLKARGLRQQADHASSISNVFAEMFLYAPMVCLVLSVLASIEGCTTKRGPLLGLVGELTCPYVCKGCEPPLTLHFWSTSSGSKSVGHQLALCDTTKIRPSTMEHVALMSWYDKFPHQEVPGGAALLFAVSYLVLFPVSFLPALVLAIRGRSRLKRKEPELLQQLAPLEAELRAAGALDAAYAGLHARHWSVPIFFCLFMVFAMGSCSSMGLAFCTSSPPGPTAK
jgi:hypothetical protein